MPSGCLGRRPDWKFRSKRLAKWRRFLGHDLADDIRPKLDPDAPFSLYHGEVNGDQSWITSTMSGLLTVLPPLEHQPYNGRHDDI